MKNPEEEIYPLDKMSSPPARYATAGRATNRNSLSIFK